MMFRDRDCPETLAKIEKQYENVYKNSVKLSNNACNSYMDLHKIPSWLFPVYLLATNSAESYTSERLD